MSSYFKRFSEWMRIKSKLHASDSKPPRLNTGEVWWASLGENIGAEINGKSRLFTRPVLIFKKFSGNFFFVIPLTTQKHVGSWYVSYVHQGKEITACLHQARALDFKRLYSRMGRLSDDDFETVKDGFKKLYF